MWRSTAFLSDPVGILASVSRLPAVNPPRSRRLAASALRTRVGIAALALMLTAVAGCGLFGGDGPEEAAQAFAAAWSGGDDRGAAALTDDPAAATALLTSVRDVAGPGRPGRAGRPGAHRVRHGHGLRWTCAGTSGRAASGATTARRVCAAPPTDDGPAWRVAGRRRSCIRSWPPASGSRCSTGAAEPAPGRRPGRRAAAHRRHRSSRCCSTGSRPATCRPSPGPWPRRSRRSSRRSPRRRSPTARRAPPTAAPTPSRCCARPTTARSRTRSTICRACGSPPPSGCSRPDAGFARQVLPAVRTALAAQLDGVPGWSVAVGRRRRRHGRHARRGDAEARARRRPSRWTAPCRPPPRTPSSRSRSRRCSWRCSLPRASCSPSPRTVPRTRPGRSPSPAASPRVPPSKS